MSWQKVWRLAGSDYLKLVPVLVLAFYITFIPHINYPYPVHIDEWVHLAYSEALMQANSTAFVEPFFGESTMGISSDLELGYHLFWGVFKSISGISWLTIFRYFPGIVFIMTVLSVFILARRDGFGWEAAFFTCMITTTVGIMGPAFLVPVAMGLLFIALSLFLVFHVRSWWSYLVLFLFTCFLLSLHATTAVGMIIILIPFILLNLKGNFKHSLGITLALAIPFLVLFPWVFDIVLREGKVLFIPTTVPTWIDIPWIMRAYGYLPVAICFLGTLLMGVRRDKKSYGLVLGLLALLLVLVTYYKFHYGIQALYTRGLMYLMLMVSIVAGAGLMGIRKLKLPEKLDIQVGSTRLAQYLGPVLCLALIGVSLAQAIPYRQNIPYYHMIDEHDYEAFTWIKDNIGTDYQKAILDPWKATAFVAITGKYVYTRIHEAPKDTDEEARKFLDEGCTDTKFLRKNNISIVYNLGDCNNPDLTKVRENIYLLKEAGAP